MWTCLEHFLILSPSPSFIFFFPLFYENKVCNNNNNDKLQCHSLVEGEGVSSADTFMWQGFICII